MLYLYDDAISKDLKKSLNPNNIETPQVKVIDVDSAIDVLAQLQDDNITFPAVLLTRYPDTPIDSTRYNFTRAHRGVASVLDTDTNELYYEKAVPVQLKYDLTILAANTADRDELVKELIFKYTSMYFITFTLPYECKRKVRFGVVIDRDESISSKSGTLESLQEGKLYQTIIPLRCEGCIWVSYTPVKLHRHQFEVKPVNKGQEP